MSSSRRNFRQRRTSSSSEEETVDLNDDSGANVKLSKYEKIEELKFIQKQRERKHGIDVYSLAIGEQESTNAKSTEEKIDNDPWKKKTGGLVDLKVLKEKRGNEIVTSMSNNFARETNQRDEDAEMQKFIDEQINLKKQLESEAQAYNEDGTPRLKPTSDSTVSKFKRPEDALFDLPKYLIENTSKHRSEESLSEQMLSGIPEVDLGVEERIRNIEDTEKAKQTLITHRSAGQSSMGGKYKKVASSTSDSQYAPHNTSVNFVQHKRFDDALINPDHMIKPRVNRPNTALTSKLGNQPVVGDAPKHELLQQAQTQTSNYKKHHHVSKPTNPNARRQYHVSTNMNEEFRNNESQDINQICDANSKSDSKDEIAKPTTSEQAKDDIKKPHQSNKRANNGTEKASDDYCLERFKKNMRFSRSTKIKIA